MSHGGADRSDEVIARHHARERRAAVLVHLSHQGRNQGVIKESSRSHQGGITSERHAAAAHFGVAARRGRVDVITCHQGVVKERREQEASRGGQRDQLEGFRHLVRV